MRAFAGSVLIRSVPQRPVAKSHERRVDMPRSAILESQEDLDDDDWDDDEEELDGDLEELDLDGYDSDIEDEDDI